MEEVQKERVVEVEMSWLVYQYESCDEMIGAAEDHSEGREQGGKLETTE